MLSAFFYEVYRYSSLTYEILDRKYLSFEFLSRIPEGSFRLFTFALEPHLLLHQTSRVSTLFMPGGHPKEYHTSDEAREGHLRTKRHIKTGK